MGIRTVLDSRGLRPQKKWGQHFLTDPRILETIADAAEVQATDTILEIGPGLGHLTRVLARRARQVVSVEIDAGLSEQLRKEFALASNVTIRQGNFLDAAPIEWLGKSITGAELSSAPVAIPFKIVANLPYYITSAILRHILEAVVKPRVIVVMVQREVAQRIVARPPTMNLLAVSVQCFAQPRIMRTIRAGAFYPPPKVDSAVVRMDVFEPARIAPGETTRFFEIVHAGFGTRRKQLRNALAQGLGRSPQAITLALERAGVDPTRRAETLTLDEWIELYRELA
jgi:16S rRNA (adenine1518-N6/adenine1519-N6)-dimethyltransferase